MELRLLRYFVAVAEELNFGRAARRLFVAQPSLSAQIQKLERELGTPVFVRDRRTVTLTPAGQALLAPARRLLADADDLPSLARAAAGGGRLSVGFVPYARGHLLSGLLDALRHARPTAEVTVRHGSDSPEVFTDLRDGLIDAGILRSPVAAPWLGSLVLAVEPFYAALPAGHALAARTSVRLAELALDAFALFPRELNPPAYDNLMGFFTTAGYRPTIGQSSRRMEESLVFVASGGGVGLFPESVSHAVNDPGIVFRPITEPVPTVQIVLGWDIHSLNPLVPDLVQAAQGIARRAAVRAGDAAGISASNVTTPIRTVG